MKIFFFLAVSLLIAFPAQAQVNLGTSASSTNPQRTSDATTGFFSSTTGAISTSSGGTEMMRVNGTGVGIGTTNPKWPFQTHVGTDQNWAINTSSSHPQFGAINDAASGYVTGTIDAAPLLLNTISGGDVGIGTTSPVWPFQTHVGTNQNWAITSSSSHPQFGAINDAASGYVTGTIDAAPLLLNTISGGSIGIGTTSPAYALDVRGTAGSTIASNGLPVINKVNVQKFTSSGTYTPSTKMVYALVEVIGGGGGGAGAPAPVSGAGSGGGGGGGGAYARAIKTAATIGASQTVTIGAGGAAGSSSCCSQSGGSGGSSSLGTLITAGGGSGGTQLNTSCNTVCQTGGIGSGGSAGGTYDYGASGQSGSYGMVISGWQASIGGAGGVSGAGSPGGATAMPASGVSAAITGISASGYGGGGGGGSSAFGGAIGGGAGAQGVVVITEYISD